MKINLCVLLFLANLSLHAQPAFTGFAGGRPVSFGQSRYAGHTLPAYPAKLFQRNYGAIIGLQRGSVTSVELGGEAHWRKISLKKPHIIGATANLEYNFGNHVIGYKAGAWMKRGRVNLTYGANAVYFTDFKGRSRYGLGPAVGFRLLGFHLINGYNFLGGDKELDKVNTLYVSLRYYFPLENKFTWDRKNKEKEKRKKEKAKKKKQKEKEKRKKDNPGLFGDRFRDIFRKT